MFKVKLNKLEITYDYKSQEIVPKEIVKLIKELLDTYGVDHTLVSYKPNDYPIDIPLTHPISFEEQKERSVLRDRLPNKIESDISTPQESRPLKQVQLPNLESPEYQLSQFKKSGVSFFRCPHCGQGALGLLPKEKLYVIRDIYSDKIFTDSLGDVDMENQVTGFSGILKDRELEKIDNVYSSLVGRFSELRPITLSPTKENEMICPVCEHTNTIEEWVMAAIMPEDFSEFNEMSCQLCDGELIIDSANSTNETKVNCESCGAKGQLLPEITNNKIRQKIGY